MAASLSAVDCLRKTKVEQAAAAAVAAAAAAAAVVVAEEAVDL